MSEGANTSGTVFRESRACFEEMVGFLVGDEALALSHGELEKAIDARGREMLRRLYQDHLRLRAATEQRLCEVYDAEGSRRGSVEAGHARALATVFGEVEVKRLAYRSRGQTNLHPADAWLNLPEERHSHGLREVAAIESTRGSFESAQEAIARSTGHMLAKRQLEELTRRAAADVEAFYEGLERPAGSPKDVLVVSVDGKGIVMRPEALRPATAAAAAKANPKLKTRLSKGEKRNRKRMAEVGSVYEVSPVSRTPADVLPEDEDAHRVPAPKAKAKWLTASVVEDAAVVVATVFDEAQRRDPTRERTWVALVDGNNHQITRIQAEAQARNVHLDILVDFIHVLEYLWSAAWSFFSEGDPAAEAWVREKALAILDGQASTVAAAIRRKATRLALKTSERANADTCADYLLNKRDYLDYPKALAQGWPIATGVIEGACRHLVKDRMDLTGARWGLEGAEAVLKLRAIRSNGDFPSYWAYHAEQEQRRVHQTRYLNGAIPRAA